ncbi:hypothetical protein BGZ70_006083 [Mortierella alpina]|uniref:F-box domain-containing protein n=1 Tax=Mortierella alpina TaxID=64518 RepID=A0A9P6M432_MORAP|nr:hypothetical protein BGZ70_006083 [Mortierella alpina]
MSSAADPLAHARKKPALLEPASRHLKPTRSSFSQLPLELAFLVLSYLPYRSLAALSAVDHYWRQLTFQQDSILWYRLCQRHGFLPGPATFPPPGHTRPRWTVAQALAQRPGFTRALDQSRQRLIASQGTAASEADPGSLDHPSLDSTVHRSALSTKGNVESWRDFFQASIVLEREWLGGKRTVKELRGHDEAVLSVKTLRNGDRIDSTVIVWRDIQDYPYLKPLKILDLGIQIMCMDLDDNLDLAVAAVSGVVKIISIETFSSLGTFQYSIPHLCTAVALSKTKVEVAIGLNYYAWDRETKAQVGFISDAHFENIACMKVDTNKKLLFTGSQDSKVRIFSWESKPMLLRQYGGHRGGVRCMTLQDGMIITGATDKTAMITFRDRHEAYRIDALSADPLLGETDSFGEAERVAEPVSLSHPAYVNAVDADASMVVTGADDGVVRIFNFGSDLWRPPAPPSPKLCGQTSLVSSASSTCVLMARPGRNKVSVGNRRQTWGTCALAVLARANLMLHQSQAQDRQAPMQTETRSLAWMNVDEIYKCMLEWELQPVSQGSTPKHTLNLALLMMAKSEPPTILLDSTVSPHRFAVE